MNFLVAEYSEVLIRLLIASLFGGIVGLERDIHGRDAGLRTHLLVSLGAAVFMVLSEVIATLPAGSAQIADPSRIAAQIVTGIGFLGAGVIIKAGVNVRGLTTAASLWTVAAIGMAAGGGHYGISLVATLIALSGLVLLKHFERIYAKDFYRNLRISTPMDVKTEDIIAVVRRKDLSVLSCTIEKDYETATMVTMLSFRIRHKGNIDTVADGIIASLETSSLGLKKVKWS
ncbi:MAG: MgtC/SapB family protein [bacterium]